MATMIPCLLNGQYQITIPKHRADRPQWYTKEGWEKERLSSMHSKLTPSDTILYIGAEEGEMAALCQMWGAKVILFEPNELVWPNIGIIWEANKLDLPLYSFPGFAANRNNRLDALVKGFPTYIKGEVIGNHGFKELSDPANMPQIKIDTLVEKIKIIPTAITLDVEGSEWEVLRGAEKLLKEHRPKIWLSGHPEFLYFHFGEHLGDLRRWLKDIGYTEELLAYDHEVHLYYE